MGAAETQAKAEVLKGKHGVGSAFQAVKSSAAQGASFAANVGNELFTARKAFPLPWSPPPSGWFSRSHLGPCSLLRGRSRGAALRPNPAYRTTPMGQRRGRRRWRRRRGGGGEGEGEEEKEKDEEEKGRTRRGGGGGAVGEGGGEGAGGGGEGEGEAGWLPWLRTQNDLGNGKQEGWTKKSVVFV